MALFMLRKPKNAVAISQPTALRGKRRRETDVGTGGCFGIAAKPGRRGAVVSAHRESRIGQTAEPSRCLNQRRLVPLRGTIVYIL